MEEKIPVHLGIIMDGNGRWAKERGMIRTMGHKEGSKTLKKVCEHAKKRGIKYLSIYAFSTENFKRDKTEVEFLMRLFEEMFENEIDYLKKNNVRLLFSGRKEPLSKKLLALMSKGEEETKDNTGLVFHICINYGGQSEIVDAVKKIASEVLEKKLSLDEINEELIRQNLYQDLPPLDFVIRTSGEKRISNFMLWQSAYAEYYFPDVYFPDFNEEELDIAILEYQKRDRRFGGIKDENKNN